MKINWKVRFNNKAFWITLMPAVLVLISVVASIFGITLDLGDLSNKLIGVIGAVFTVLSILGIVTDPTTNGVSDSTKALDYVHPARNAKQQSNV